jgi:glycosyltransferase involved in cell wall biosynthesis
MNVPNLLKEFVKSVRLYWDSLGVSIIIPFRSSNPNNQRTRNFEWLFQYWSEHLPGAEIIEGHDPEEDKPFSKSVAINCAVKKSTGDVLVIVDADGYISAEVVLKCVQEIRKARSRGRRLWFVPYRRFYRLTQKASSALLASSPSNPKQFSCPPSEEHTQGDTDPSVGHWYGAMIQIMPREAFSLVGGWDPRFRGWGGEDHAAMRAMDTLYWPHKTMPVQVLHVWHPQLGPSGPSAWVHWKDRMWEGQTDPSVNDRLSWRYYHASGKPTIMRKLVNEGVKIMNASKHKPHKPHKHKKQKHHHHHCHHHRKSV